MNYTNVLANKSTSEWRLPKEAGQPLREGGRQRATLILSAELFFNGAHESIIVGLAVGPSVLHALVDGHEQASS